jgi:hypothetical protein
VTRTALVGLVITTATAMATACSGPFHEIVEDRFEISEARGMPDISVVSDVGGGDVPLTGVLMMQPSDGVSVIGETLWIRGKSFGRQPTVLVGGRPAIVLGRTRDGGIAVRVPPATPSGTVSVVVRNENGKDERAITVKRYAAVLAPGSGQLGWAEVAADGPSAAAGQTPIRGARFLRLSPDGRAAYVAQAGRSLIDVIELPAPSGPKPVYQLDLGPAPVIALVAAARASVLGLVRDADVVLIDATSPLHPARSAPRPLPKEVRDARIVAADLSPDGKTLAVASEVGNKIMLIDLAARGRAALTATIRVLPDVRESVLVDIAFSPTGDTLWVLSGDTSKSRAIGPQPTELRAIRLLDTAGGVPADIARVVRIEDAAEPARVSVGRSLPLASGGAIRLPPERAQVFVAAMNRAGAETGTQGEAATPTEAAPASPGAAVFRVGAEDIPTAVLTTAGRFGFADLTTDGRWLLAPAAGDDGSVRVLATAVDGRPAPVTRPIDVVAAGAGETPPAARPAPVLRVQP